MKVLIVSDTHKRNDNFFQALSQVGKVDLVIHCGDIEGSEYTIEAAAGCPVEMVAGNNDFFSDLPPEKQIEIRGYQVLITHGHHYYVSMGKERLRQEARSRGIDIVFYGHTHRPDIDLTDSVMLVNPGSISYPRQEGRQPSYAVMDIERQGEVHFTLGYL